MLNQILTNNRSSYDSCNNNNNNNNNNTSIWEIYSTEGFRFLQLIAMSGVFVGIWTI